MLFATGSAPRVAAGHRDRPQDDPLLRLDPRAHRGAEVASRDRLGRRGRRVRVDVRPVRLQGDDSRGAAADRSDRGRGHLARARGLVQAAGHDRVRGRARRARDEERRRRRSAGPHVGGEDRDDAGGEGAPRGRPQAALRRPRARERRRRDRARLHQGRQVHEDQRARRLRDRGRRADAVARARRVGRGRRGGRAHGGPADASRSTTTRCPAARTARRRSRRSA